jgi:hypothetical protein
MVLKKLTARVRVILRWFYQDLTGISEFIKSSPPQAVPMVHFLLVIAHLIALSFFIDALRTAYEMVSSTVHSIERAVDRFKYRYGFKIAVDYTPVEGQDAALVLKALQVVVHQGWLKSAKTLSTSKGVHAYAKQNLSAHVYVNQHMPAVALQAILQRASTTHLAIDTLQGGSTKLHSILEHNLATLTALTTVRMNNVLCRFAEQFLSIIGEHSPRVSVLDLMQTERIPQPYILQNTACPDSVRTLLLKNITWRCALPQLLQVLHIEGWDLSSDVQLPSELKELKLVNSRVLPSLPYGLQVLDLSKSGITQLTIHITSTHYHQRYYH